MKSVQRIRLGVINSPSPEICYLPARKGDRMKFPLLALLVGIAGFAGSITRWLVGRFFGQLNINFPLGTLVINITGSLLLGWFLAHAAKHQFSPSTRAIIGTGFVGAYTTFSTYMYESNALLSESAQLKAYLNLFGSMILGIAAVRLGFWIARFT